MRKLKNIKITLFFLCIMILSGCANKSANISQQKNNNPQNPLQAVAATEPRKELKILFVGDMMFDRYIREAVGQHGGDYAYPLLSIKNYLSQFDLVVGNLEGPITSQASSSVDTKMDEKKNLVFTFDPAVAKVLVQNKIDLVSIGNNHILNQGSDGVRQTKKYLDEASVGYFGDAGADEDSTFVKNINGTKIGFVNYNYSVTGSLEKALAGIKDLKSKCDLVILCPHWGK